MTGNGQFGMIGTVNQPVFLKDPTGNRRYYPVPLRLIRLDELRQDRDQIWAEAVFREKASEGTAIPEQFWKTQTEENSKLLVRNEIQEVLVDKLGELGEGCWISRDTLWSVVGVTGIADQNRYGADRRHAMDELQFIEYRPRVGGKQLQRSYYRPRKNEFGIATAPTKWAQSIGMGMLKIEDFPKDQEAAVLSFPQPEDIPEHVKKRMKERKEQRMKERKEQ